MLLSFQPPAFSRMSFLMAPPVPQKNIAFCLRQYVVERPRFVAFPASTAHDPDRRVPACKIVYNIFCYFIRAVVGHYNVIFVFWIIELEALLDASYRHGAIIDRYLDGDGR